MYGFKRYQFIFIREMTTAFKLNQLSILTNNPSLTKKNRIFAFIQKKKSVGYNANIFFVKSFLLSRTGINVLNNIYQTKTKICLMTNAA